MTTQELYPVLRRDVLKTIGLGAAVGAFGVSTMSGSVAASSHVTETIYLSHSVDSEGVTKLFTVDLDGTPGNAILSEVTSIDAPFQNVDAIAATPDGASVMFVDRNTAHLGEFDVSGGGFTDHGVITGLPTITVLAAFGLDGKLYAASNTTNKLYTIDYSGSPPVANEVGTITGATVNGADIVVDSTGTMFLHTNNDDTLYSVDYQNPSGGMVAATVVGSDAGSSLTGLAVREAGTGDLVGSSRADDAIVVLDKTDGSRTATLPMILDGNPYSYTNGDMATGVIVDETCVCDLEEPVKFEFVVDEEDDEVTWHGFRPEDATTAFAFLTYENKAGEEYEPISVTFETEQCVDDLVATVKAGREAHEAEMSEDGDGNLVVTIDFEDSPFVNDKNGKLYAISYVEFTCPEDDTGN